MRDSWWSFLRSASSVLAGLRKPEGQKTRQGKPMCEHSRMNLDGLPISSLEELG